MSEDVFHDDHRVVDHDAGDQHEGKQADGVQGNPGDLHDQDGAQKRERDSDGSEQGISQTEAEPQNQEHQGHPQREVAAQGAQRIVDLYGGIVGEYDPDGVLGVLGRKGPGGFFDRLGDVDGVSVDLFCHPEPNGIFTVDRRDQDRIPVAHPCAGGQVCHAHEVAVAVFSDHHIEHLLLAAQPGAGVEHELGLVFAESAGGDLGVGRGDGICGLVEGDAEAAEQCRVERDVKLFFEISLHARIPHLRHRQQAGAKLFGVKFQGPLRHVSGDIDHDHREPHVGVHIREDRLVDFHGQLVAYVENPEAQVVVERLVVGVVDELHLDVGKVPIGLGLDVFHVFQAVEGVFDLGGDQFFHVLGRCAEVDGPDEHLAHVDGGHVLQGGGKSGKPTGHHEDHEHNVDEHFLADRVLDDRFHG